jgi:putative membrane protein
MSEGDFFSDVAKRATAQSVRNAEAATSAEVVVAVRKRSGNYGVLAYHFGLGAAAAVVLYLLAVPREYSVGAIVLDGALAFLLGALLAANFDTLLRALSLNQTLQHHVGTSARAAFFDLGISRTSGRSGVLIYVSLFERRALVLADIGIDVAALEPEWSTALRNLEQAVKRRDLAAFGKAVESLGPALGRAYPRRADDVNELPDEVQ